jgi:hypothetical protein
MTQTQTIPIVTVAFYVQNCAFVDVNHPTGVFHEEKIHDEL